jgi:hypothetical protein
MAAAASPAGPAPTTTVGALAIVSILAAPATAKALACFARSVERGGG